MNPHHDRPALIARARRRPNVKIKTVLAFGFWPEILNRGRQSRRLHGARTELPGVAHALPCNGRLRRAPPQLAGRGLCIRYAPEGAHGTVGADGSLQLTAFDPYSLVVHSR